MARNYIDVLNKKEKKDKSAVYAILKDHGIKNRLARATTFKINEDDWGYKFTLTNGKDGTIVYEESNWKVTFNE